MPKIDDYEREILSAFEKDKLKSVATRAELAGYPVWDMANLGAA